MSRRAYAVACARRAVLCVCVLAVLGACDDYPRDGRGTLDRVEGGILRAGVSHHPPWICVTTDGAGEAKVSGMEAALLERWARQLHAQVEWRVGTESGLVAGLRNDRVDIVAAGLAEDTPWASQAALSNPAVRADHRVFAVAQGESAFLLALERFLHADTRPGGEPACGGDR